MGTIVYFSSIPTRPTEQVKKLCQQRDWRENEGSPSFLVTYIFSELFFEKWVSPAAGTKNASHS